MMWKTVCNVCWCKRWERLVTAHYLTYDEYPPYTVCGKKNKFKPSNKHLSQEVIHRLKLNPSCNKLPKPEQWTTAKIKNWLFSHSNIQLNGKFNIKKRKWNTWYHTRSNCIEVEKIAAMSARNTGTSRKIWNLRSECQLYHDYVLAHNKVKKVCACNYL